MNLGNLKDFVMTKIYIFLIYNEFLWYSIDNGNYFINNNIDLCWNNDAK